tara:strand:- start:194 stop:376 length:183 start_codon:yes stop_codon:yes gene_type:complete
MKNQKIEFPNGCEDQVASLINAFNFKGVRYEIETEPYYTETGTEVFGKVKIVFIILDKQY